MLNAVLAAPFTAPRPASHLPYAIAGLVQGPSRLTAHQGRVELRETDRLSPSAPSSAAARSNSMLLGTLGGALMPQSTASLSLSRLLAEHPGPLPQSQFPQGLLQPQQIFSRHTHPHFAPQPSFSLPSSRESRTEGDRSTGRMDPPVGQEAFPLRPFASSSTLLEAEPRQSMSPVVPADKYWETWAS